MEFSPLEALSRPHPPTFCASTVCVSRLTSSSSKGFVNGRVGSRSRAARNTGVQGASRVVRSRWSSFLRSKIAVAAMARSVEVKKGVELKVYENSGQLGQELAAYVANLSESAIRERGVFSVAFSGGSLFNSLGNLTEESYIGKIDWSRWHVFWADERVVPLDHPDSNYKLAYDGLLSKVSIPSGQVYAINHRLSPQAAAADYELGVRQLVKTNVLPLAETGEYPRLDLILLGMGPDGHIASLFPHHPLVNKTEVWIASIEDSPKPPPERITFTLPVINSAANVAFVATGSSKADKMKLIFGPDLPFGELPAQLVAPYKGALVWFTDKAAAANL